MKGLAVLAPFLKINREQKVIQKIILLPGRSFIIYPSAGSINLNNALQSPP